MPRTKEWFKKTSIIITSSILLIIIGHSSTFLLINHTPLTRESLSLPPLVATYAFLVMFVVPILIAKRAFHITPKTFGLVIPSWQVAGKLTFWITLPLVISAFFLAKQAPFQEYYAASNAIWGYFLINTLASALYYFAEEFIFRGLLFFSLLKRVGLHAFWIVNGVFALFHLGKPLAEVPIAFFSGLLFTYLSYKTRSFIPAAVSHFIFALVLNALVTFVYVPEVTGAFRF